jgi:hypothetical protein
LSVGGRTLRRILILAAALALTGCESLDFGSQDPSEFPAGANPAALPVKAQYQTAEVRPMARSNCEWAARKRAEDTDLQGFDPEIQQSVYDKTYADCMTWSQRLAR